MLEVGQIFIRGGIQLCVLDLIDYNSKKYALISAEDDKIEFLFYEMIHENGKYNLNLVSDDELNCILLEKVEEKINE